MLENISPKVWAALVGAVGAVIGMTTIVTGLTWRQKISMLFAGMALAVLFTPIIVEWMQLPESWSDGVSALIGILGWAAVGKVLLTIQSADAWGLFADVVRGWFGRRS